MAVYFLGRKVDAEGERAWLRGLNRLIRVGRRALLDAAGRKRRDRGRVGRQIAEAEAKVEAESRARKRGGKRSVHKDGENRLRSLSVRWADQWILRNWRPGDDRAGPKEGRHK